MGKFKEDLGLALELAGHADVVTMHRFEASDLSVKEKPDMSPVSDADLTCEKQIRESLKRSRPRDEVLGEEYGGEACYKGRQWVIDPIDGTKNFVRGVPVWATLISLLEDGEPVVSVSRPAPPLVRGQGRGCLPRVRRRAEAFERFPRRKALRFFAGDELAYRMG